MDSNNMDLNAMMQNLMQNAKKFQEQFANAANKDKTVEAFAGGDMVKATVNLHMQVTDLQFKPELMQEDPDVMRELIVGAINSGLIKAKETLKEDMKSVTKDMGIPDHLASKFSDSL